MINLKFPNKNAENYPWESKQEKITLKNIQWETTSEKVVTEKQINIEISIASTDLWPYLNLHLCNRGKKSSLNRLEEIRGETLLSKTKISISIIVKKNTSQDSENTKLLKVQEDKFHKKSLKTWVLILKLKLMRI